ncbi:MAG: hypothetical protein ABR613_10660 [Actinomycetota bacterium]
MDGDEYREGITRCPEHDVDLVEEPPEPDEDEGPLLGWPDDRAAVRLAFLVLIAAGAVYAVSGVVFGVLLWFPSVRESGEATALRLAQAVNAGAWAIGMAALGALGGAVLVKTYALLRGRSRLEHPATEPAPGAAMRLLFGLVIVFSVLWAVTGVATSWENAELSTGFYRSQGPDDPSDAFVALVAVNSAAYACAVGSFAVMAAALARRVYARVAARH